MATDLHWVTLANCPTCHGTGIAVSPVLERTSTGYLVRASVCPTCPGIRFVGRDTVAESPVSVSENAAKYSATATASRHEIGVPQDDSQ